MRHERARLRIQMNKTNYEILRFAQDGIFHDSGISCRGDAVLPKTIESCERPVFIGGFDSGAVTFIQIVIQQVRP